MGFVVEDIWKQVLEQVETAVGALAFKTWLKRLDPVTCNGSTLVLAAPDEITQSNALRYEPLILNALTDVTSMHMSLSIILKQEEEQFRNRNHFAQKQERFFSTYSDNASPLNPKYTFETFVVGQSNAFAHSACVSVAERRGVFNPLFLYGGSGMGKTHLLHAIGNYVQRTQPDRSVLYVPCESFVNEFISTIKEGNYDAFREKYRNCDMLLIDDIQFIESKEQTQIEFFSTFNSLYESGCNIILSCDKPPQSLSTLEDRLRSRFSSGLIIDISQPEFETRCAILEKWAQQENLILPTEITEFIASNFVTSVRQLEGAYRTFRAYSELAGSVTLETAQISLKNLISPVQKQMTPEMILDMIARYFQLSLEELKSKQKSKEKAIARQVAMYLLAKHTRITYEQIGQILNKHHSTVMHGYSKIQEELQEGNPEITKAVELLSNRILGQEDS